MMPFTVFMILGILQLSLTQQARLLTQYAAFRAARAGSLRRADCVSMVNAAVMGILPSYGRTDSAKALEATWTTNAATHGNPSQNLTNISGSGANLKHIVRVSYLVEGINGGPSGAYQATDFDDPGKGLRLSTQVIYNYEMRIPFANWMISEMWTGGNYFKSSFDVLSPSKKSAANVKPLDQSRIDQSTDNAGSKNGRYFLPIPASGSMRMMSNPGANVAMGSATQCNN